MFYLKQNENVFEGSFIVLREKKFHPNIERKNFSQNFFPFDKSFSGCAVAVVAVVDVVDAAVVVAVVAAAGKG